MVVYEEQYFDSVSDLMGICWSGAIQRLEEVQEMDDDKQEQFIDYIKMYLGDEEHLSTTTLNDFIWFECDDFIEELQEETSEDEEDI